jgi:hypothetical protein
MRTFFNQEDMFAIQDYFVTLIQNLTSFHHPAQVGPFGILLLVQNRNPGAQRVANENWFRKSQFIVSIGKGDRIDFSRGESNSYGECHGSVGDALAEWGLAGKLGIDVMGEKVSTMPGVDDDIGFRDGSSGRDAVGADLVVLEILGSGHRWIGLGKSKVRR